jgi:serine/threonine-protein kinase
MGELFLDRYEAEHEVGQGGMAIVYRGIDRVLHRPVAIKVLHRHLSQKAEARARFAREARVIAKLRHPNVVEIYDFAGEDSERAFIVAEFVDGETLSAFLDAHGPILPELAAQIARSSGEPCSTRTNAASSTAT